MILGVELQIFAEDIEMFGTCNKCGYTESRSFSHLQSLRMPSQSIKYLLRANDYPSDSQVSEIRAMIDGAFRDLGQLDADIKELEGILTQLRTERDEHNEHIDAFRSTLSPVRRIPAELLTSIFIFAVHDVRTLMVFPNLEGPCNPWPLSQVCALWRGVALATHALWSYFLEFHPQHQLLLDTPRRKSGHRLQGFNRAPKHACHFFSRLSTFPISPSSILPLGDSAFKFRRRMWFSRS